VPDQPVPRLSFDSGVTLQGDAPQPDQPARMPEDGADGEAELAAVTPDGPAEQAAGASVIRILTGPYPPYTGRDLPEQGMLTEVVSRALDHAAPERERRIAFVGDWSAHLDVLLPDGAFDIGFPWFKPDCSRMELLGEEMRRRCTDYNWSQPLHELVVGYFVRAGSGIEGATDYDDLLGLTFCRPEGYYGFDLEQKGLSAPRIALLTPATPADCLRALADGEADVVSLSVTLVEAEIAELGLAGRIAELPELADILTLHALAPKSNPSGRAYLTLVNRGLREMRESGEWFRVVARHLAAAQ
jgi:polar amino acid transport system substrate-binding protein